MLDREGLDMYVVNLLGNYWKRVILFVLADCELIVIAGNDLLGHFLVSALNFLSEILFLKKIIFFLKTTHTS